MLTIISATATGFRSRSSKEAERCRRQARVRRSRPGEFILGYLDEIGLLDNLPQPEILSRNGSYMAYRRLARARREVSRVSCGEHGETPDEQELLAAKLMGRWRSGAPLVLSPDKDDPALGADPQRNNDFNYKEMDPHGYAVPLGSHARRMNPRDTAANINRRRMIRRGATYWPHLPDNAFEDGAERGIAAFVICASLDAPVRVRTKRVGERPEFSRTRQRTRPHHRQSRRDARIYDSQAADSEENRGLPAFTTVARRSIFFSSGSKGTSISRVVERRAGPEPRQR